MKNLKALQEKKASLQKELRAMSEKIETEVRAMSAEESQKWDELTSEVQNITNTVEAIQTMRTQEEGAEDQEEVAEGDASQESRDNRAFANYIRAIISKEDRADANLDFSSSSNAIVPKTVAQKIVARIYDISPVVERATKYVTKGTLEVPVYGANGSKDIKVAYATEFSDLESNIGKFDSVELQGFLAGALVKLSNSLINNTDLDLVNFAVERIAYEVARFMEGELLNGTTGKIEGLTTLEAAQNVQTEAASVISVDDLITVKNRVKQALRKGAIWVMSQDTKTVVEKMKDGMGRPIFNEDLTGEYDGKLLGYPVYISDNMAEIADGARAVVFGDPAGLALKWTEQLEIQVLREKYATQHATGLVAWLEADAKVENNQMLASLTVKAAA